MPYTPDYIDTVSELIAKKAALLKPLVGQRLLSSYVVWDIVENEWFFDGPVILIFEEKQIELCCNKLEEISITSGATDIGANQIISWDPEGPYEWRKNALEEINYVIDSALEKINIIEFEFTTWPAGENSSSPNTSSNWILNGLDFYFSKGFFTFFNALDENGITNKETRDVNIRKFDLDGRIVI